MGMWIFYQQFFDQISRKICQQNHMFLHMFKGPSAGNKCFYSIQELWENYNTTRKLGH